jgi:hypothetical protein
LRGIELVMDGPGKEGELREYVMVFRAPSAAMFLPGTYLRARCPREEGAVMLTFRTRQVDKGLGETIPGHLWIDARSLASSLEDAVSFFGNAAASVLPVIAFSSNAAIGNMMFELGYDNTVGVSERELMQSMIPEEGAIVQQSRTVNVEAILGLMALIEAHKEKERIGRSIAQYALALRQWRWGYETLATAHLYMGMEALTKAVIRDQEERAGVSIEELALQLGIDVEALGPCKRLSTEVEAGVRRKILFRDDRETYKKAKRASDGFEHGFMPFDEVRDLARNVRNRTAAYLREAILDLVDVKGGLKDVVLSAPFDEPLGRWPVVKYARGYLLGDGERLARGENVYPILSWKSSIESVELNDSGEYKVDFRENFTAELGKGIKFRLRSFEVWAP